MIPSSSHARLVAAALLTLACACGGGSGGGGGTGGVPPSPPPPSPTPTLPGAPTSVAALPGDGRALLTWSAPAGAGVASYVVQVLRGGTSVASAAALGTSLDVTGLTNGVEHQFTVAARNEAGTGPASAPSAAVVPAAGGVATGVFADAPTSGLRYASGGLSGVTSPGGHFSYAPGSPVAFSVGGIRVGTAPAAAILTPVSLLGGASASDPTVARIAQFLQSLDEDGDPSNGITIPASVDAAAAGMTLDLSSATDAQVASALATLSSRAPVTQAAATDHLARTVHAVYEGEYAGTWSGTVDLAGSKVPVSGKSLVTIDASGAVRGWVEVPIPAGSVSRFPATGQLDTTGTVIFSGTGTTTTTYGSLTVTTTVTGILDASTGTGTGTYVTTGSLTGSGTYSSARTTSRYAAHYAGTYGGTDSGTWDVTVSADGTVSGTGSSATIGTFRVAGTVTASGELSANAAAGTTPFSRWTSRVAYDGSVFGTWQGAGGGVVTGARVP